MHNFAGTCHAGTSCFMLQVLRKYSLQLGMGLVALHPTPQDRTQLADFPQTQILKPYRGLTCIFPIDLGDGYNTVADCTEFLYVFTEYGSVLDGW